MTIEKEHVDELNRIINGIYGGKFTIDNGCLNFRNNLGFGVSASRLRKDKILKIINEELIPSGLVLKSSDDHDRFELCQINPSKTKRLKFTKKYKHSFLKWAGGKGKILPFLLPHFPQSASRIIEPFVGSGIVFLNTDYPNIVINDINDDLISVYREIKTNYTDLVKECKRLFDGSYNSLERYNLLREEFNTISGKNELRKAAIFIYLNKHGFNGLCRYNSKGIFNIPYGKPSKVDFLEGPIFEMHKRLSESKVKILNSDFRDILMLAKEGDVVYNDPPYTPLSTTSSFTAYHTDGFGEKDHRDLALLAEQASNNGATVIVSNHDVPLAREIYGNASVPLIEIQCGRSISCKGKGRKKVNEIVAVYKKGAK